MLKVPVAMIRRLCYPSSYRLPKLKRLQFPLPKVPVKAAPFRNPMDSTSPRLVGSVRDTIAIRGNASLLAKIMAVTNQPEVKKRGNLGNEEYRFWSGHCEPEYSDAQCRWCQAHVRSVVERKAHHTHSDCRENLMIVFRLLRKDHNCVCCDDRTPEEKWGVPLCDEKCQNEWRYSIPGSFKFAVDTLKRNLRKQPTNA